MKSFFKEYLQTVLWAAFWVWVVAFATSMLFADFLVAFVFSLMETVVKGGPAVLLVSLGYVAVRRYLRAEAAKQ